MAWGRDGLSLKVKNQRDQGAAAGLAGRLFALTPWGGWSDGLQEWPIDTKAASVGGGAGTANAHTAFGQIIDGAEYLFVPAKFTLDGNSRMHHGLGAAVVENQLV